MADVQLDARERRQLCDLLDKLGPSVPTLIEGWTACDLAAHILSRERDLVAGPCIVLPGPFQRFAERRRARLAARKDFASLHVYNLARLLRFLRRHRAFLPRCRTRTVSWK